MRCITRRSVIAAGLGLAGCAALDRSRLGDLYGGLSRPADQPPVVLIPGAFGSSLRDQRTGRELWPVSNSKLLLGNYRDLGLPLDPVTLEPDASQAEAYAVLREGLGRDFYGSVVEALQRVGGYQRCRHDRPPATDAPCSLYLYLYDFRLDTVRAARGLAALIERIRDEHADRRLQVDIVAHSNGGLVARYFVRHGTAGLPGDKPLLPSHAGAEAVRRLLLVGTPNLGTLQPVLSLVRGEEIGLRRIPPEVVATCPGLAQMLPHPAVPWLIDLQGNVVGADLYDIATWRELGWSLFDPRVAARTIEEKGGGVAGRVYLDRLREFLGRSLAEGRRFAESFATEPDSSDVPTWVFGGDCEPTLARLVVESVAGELHARESPAAIAAPGPHACVDAMFEPGDTVVTRSSLLGRRTLDVAAPRTPAESLRIAHALFFCARHQQLTGNAILQDNLLHALLSVDAA
jgi:pimeloyl-ACP methyl ester carboxylesterase